MKMQVATFALMVAAAGFANANSFQGSSQGSSESVQEMVAMSERIGEASVEFSKDGSALSEYSFNQVFTSLKDSPLSQGMSAASTSTVTSVETSVDKSVYYVTVGLKHVKSGVSYSMNFSYDVSSAAGQDSMEAARALLRFGKGLFVGVSEAGIVLVTDSVTGLEMLSTGKFKAGSSMMIGSLGHSAKAFGSKVVESVTPNSGAFPTN